MYDRKGMKKRAKAVLKKHYLLLTLLCLVAVFFGNEFSTSSSFAESADPQAEEGTTGNFDDAQGSDIYDVIQNMINNGLANEEKKTNETIESYKAESDPKSALGRTEGVLAAVVNGAASGHFITKVVIAVNNIFHSEGVAIAITIIAALLSYFAVWVFMKNIYRAIMRRIFLEARVYEVEPISNLLFFKTVKKWFHASLTMLLSAIFFFLWCLTVVGGIIKTFSYFCVPYIVAENPSLGARQTITLSRRMMDGHKMELFKYVMTMIGWHLLDYATLGIAGIFFTNAYVTAAETEFYVYIRKLAKENGIEDADLLNDDYLYEPAPDEVLQKAYYDTAGNQIYVDEHPVELTPVQRFFTENFGLWIGSTKKKREYQKIEGYKFQMVTNLRELHGKSYPTRLNPLWIPKTKELSGNIMFLRSYTIWSVILLFFLLSFIGWSWEVILHFIQSGGEFVNRGTLHGPWLPIYGTGGVACLVLLARFRRRPSVEIVSCIVLCGLIEYLTSFFLELSHGMRWWDYSGYFLNLNGRICAEGLIVFGIGCALVIYMVAPMLDTILSRLKINVVIAISLALSVLFGIDFVYSRMYPNVGKGITDTELSAPTKNQRTCV